jgi:ABC-type multidrug transport system fused ATPase/permease subunit
VKQLRRLTAYLQNYKPLVFANIFCNLMMALFTVVSIPAIIPFLQVLFERSPKATALPSWSWKVESIANYTQAYFGQLIVDKGQDVALAYICVGIVLLFFLKNLFRYLSLVAMAPIRNGIVRDIRQQLFSKVLQLPLAYFSEERKGDLMSRITADVQEVEWSILNVLEIIFRAPFIIIGSLAVMLYLSPYLTAFVFVLFFFTALIIGGIGKTLRKRSAKAQEQLGGLVTRIEEALSGLRIIKGFSAEQYQEGRFQKENNEYRNTLTRMLWRRDLSSPLSEFLGIAVVAILLWYGSREVFSGQLEPENFFAFLFAFFNIIAPAKSFSSAFYNIQKGLAAVDRIDVIQFANNAISDAPEAKEVRSFERDIVFDQVSFSYSKKSVELVLEKIDLKISKGKIIALVGASGSGKTTLVDLLPRFYDAQNGSILLDGVNIKTYTLSSLRKLMGIVSQAPVLFNDTIYNNIAFGMEGMDKEKVEEAARIANAHDFIMATEQRYQTNIGDGGGKLSGGQRQRLTIARAILKNPPILILDEATSALDAASERLVQDALNHLMEHRTTIVIAHRLSTIKHADEIIVLEKGRIAQRGSHKKLIEEEGIYKRLLALQGS